MSDLRRHESAGNIQTAEKQDKSSVGNQFVKWFFTLKCETPDGMRELSEVRRVLEEWCKNYYYQLEEGNESGYRHWQGCFQLKERDRKFPIINKFGWHDMYLMPSKDWFASINYCKKSETRIQGPWDQNSVFIETPELNKEWQIKLEKRLLGPVDYRKILIYIDTKGGAGKTDFALNHYDRKMCNYIMYGATKDLSLLLKTEGVRKTIIFDVPRGVKKINWTMIESLKNGILFSSKYESGNLRFNKPHIVLFTNNEVEMDALSLDRYEIHRF